jgi:hypothetical protein
VFTFAINPYCSSLGYYTVKECGDLCMPTLGMEQGVTYTFNQADDTNWMHPLGFAYLADGAHEGVDELEPGLPEDRACSATNSCEAPMYFVNGEYVGKYSNIAGDGLTVTGDEDFGLDVYEPDFFLDRGEWKEKGPYEVKLTLTDIARRWPRDRPLLPLPLGMPPVRKYAGNLTSCVLGAGRRPPGGEMWTFASTLKSLSGHGQN